MCPCRPPSEAGKFNLSRQALQWRYPGQCIAALHLLQPDVGVLRGALSREGGVLRFVLPHGADFGNEPLLRQAKDQYSQQGRGGSKVLGMSGFWKGRKDVVKVGPEKSGCNDFWTGRAWSLFFSCFLMVKTHQNTTKQPFLWVSYPDGLDRIILRVHGSERDGYWNHDVIWRATLKEPYFLSRIRTGEKMIWICEDKYQKVRPQTDYESSNFSKTTLLAVSRNEMGHFFRDVFFHINFRNFRNNYDKKKAFGCCSHGNIRQEPSTTLPLQIKLTKNILVKKRCWQNKTWQFFFKNYSKTQTRLTRQKIYCACKNIAFRIPDIFVSHFIPWHR